MAFPARVAVRVRVAAALVALAGLAASAAGDVTVVDRLLLPTHAGEETFLVDAPGALRSPASRVNEDRAGKDGVIPAPTPGYELTSTVIVRMVDPRVAPVLPAAGGGDAAAAVVGGAVVVGAAAPAAAPVDGLPGYWLVTTGSVREAGELAAALRKDAAVGAAYLDVLTPQPLRSPPPDPNFQAQWHLENTVRVEADLNPMPAWKQGFTGSGVTIGIIEDGWHITHPDLAANFNLLASQLGTQAGNHGTSVAGCAAAAAFNGIGGVGIAHGAGISRLYRGSTSANAAAFLFRNDLNAIKNNSWGPFDNGMATTMSAMERDALAQSVGAGRDGLGTIHIWAAGNGGTGDRVDYDPYASSRYTIAVGAIDDDDDRAQYNETGSSMMVVAHSSGGSGPNLGIVTTSGPTGYTTGFGGTSAAAPLAAGTVAMMLQARPNLTWRDVQHILIRSARRCDPGSAGWSANGAGLGISYDYGFGAVDASAAVAMARTWLPVGPEAVDESAVRTVNAMIPDLDPAGLADTVEAGADLRLEAVEVELSVLHSSIGDLRIELTSPLGTRSLLTVPRTDATDNYISYVFTSVRHWGERSAGAWTLRVADEGANDTGVWASWRLRLYGTAVCRADWNDDAAVNSSDISAFLTGWLASLQAGNLAADFNGDAAVNSSDISAFLTSWLQGVGGNC